MKRWVVGGVIAAAVIAIVIFSIQGGGPKGEKVYTEPAARRTISAVVTAPGQIDPKVKVNISAHIVGKIERLYFNEGDPVKRGQKLVELEKYLYVAQRDRLTAELASRRVEVQRARAALATAKAAFNRAQNLANQGIQAQELFDQTRLAYDNATAAYAAAQQGVSEAEAGLRQAATDLERTTIVSPIDGKVVQLNAHEGEVVVTGTMNNPGSVIAVIADLSEILVEAEVGETEVVGIRVGQEASIKVDAVADKEYRGHVVEIGSSAEVRQGAGSGVRYFDVKVAIDNSDERLRPGMTSQVSIVTSSAPNAVSVPIQAVLERTTSGDEDDENAPKKKVVYLATGNKAKQVDVQTGISDATHVVVLSGINAGDAVITGPFRTLKSLKDGAPIVVTKEEKKTSKSTTSSSDKNKDSQ
ncbi:MAG: efflux RND transporter periplasmic adaptor subunit [Acidobacteria bacterium]|nr:efflux RND transporter periplasmic adaptor subunit [Acidobacteriota bacterium]MBV9474614.1 efflux RND transporter periplasmic adaptor subunit [Acidobacteriota bacterium]